MPSEVCLGRLLCRNVRPSHDAGLEHRVLATCIVAEEISYESSSMGGVYGSLRPRGVLAPAGHGAANQPVVDLRAVLWPVEQHVARIEDRRHPSTSSGAAVPARSPAEFLSCRHHGAHPHHLRRGELGNVIVSAHLQIDPFGADAR